MYGLETAGAYPMHDHQADAGHHERRRRPVNAVQLEDHEKYEERGPFEELMHPGMIADGMSIYLQLHQVSPQRRFIRQAVEVLRSGGVIVYPTDSCYALGCHIGDKAALERIREIRQTRPESPFYPGVPRPCGRGQVCRGG